MKEQLPTFLDALRDLDDCLTLVHLFALLPAAKRHDSARYRREIEGVELGVSIVRDEETLLRKVFISVKGIYYEAEIRGEPVV